MSQRGCAGLNWPPLSIHASEPVSISPEASSRPGPAKHDAAARSGPCPRIASLTPPSVDRTPLSASELVGVGQPASNAAWFSVTFVVVKSGDGKRRASALVAVGHPVQPLSDVRGTDACSAEICRPDGVARCFQVSLYKVEPVEAVRACNLLTKDDARTALADEVPLVSKPSSFTCRAERLARTGCGPDRSAVRPAGPSQRVAPHTDAGEEVALGVSGEITWSNIFNTPIINISGGNQPGLNEVAQPLRGARVELVVVGPRHHSLHNR